MADTAPLPTVGTGARSAAPGLQQARDGRAGGAAGRGLRVLETIAGLLSGGVLVLGVVLLLSQLFAPSLLGGTGYAVATGPGWWRVGAHLAVGLAGEVGVLLRRRLPAAARVAVAVVTVVASIIVLAAAWWF